MKVFEVFVARSAQSWGEKAFLVVLAFTVLTYGSVADATFNLATTAFSLLAGLSLIRSIDSQAVGRLYAAAILLLFVLLLYVLFQIEPRAGRFVNEAWSSVNALVAPVQGIISVAPGMTYDAMPKLSLPFLVFLSALALFQGDADGLKLWRALSYFGAGYAVFGIVQDLLLPDQLFFTKKKYYVGSLTASFVNRNTAGTFFGIALLLNLGLVFYYLRKIRIGSFSKKIMALDIRWGDRNALVLLHGLFALIAAVALFLTQSRGAVAASFVGATAGVTLMTMRSLTADKPDERTGRWRRYTVNSAAVLGCIGLFALFAGRSVYRMEEQSIDDVRWCSFGSTIEAIKDHPIFGTGFGAFQDVFPAYRNPECAGIYHVWDHAHDFFLEGYLGLGAPFAVALVLGYTILIGACIRGLRNRHTLRFVPAMGLGILVLVSLHSIVDFSLQIPGVAVYLSAAMASAMTISLGRGNGRPSAVAADVTAA